MELASCRYKPTAAYKYSDFRATAMRQPQPCTLDRQLSKKKNSFLGITFSKSLFQKGTRGNFLLHRNLFTVIWKLLLGNSGVLWPGKSRTSTANTTSNLCPLNLSNIPARTGTRMKARHENPRDLLSLGLQERCKKDTPCPQRQELSLCLLLHETLQYVNTNQNRVELSKFFKKKKLSLCPSCLPNLLRRF